MQTIELPLVVHCDGDALVDHCGRPFHREEIYIDDEGSVVMQGAGTIALLDDRDLFRFVDLAESLQRIMRVEIPSRFGFLPEPKPA